MASKSATTPLKRFFGLLKEEKSQVYAIYFYAILNGLVTLSLPLGIQAILNFILGGRLSTSWGLLVAVVALGIVFSGFLQISQLQIMEKLQQRIFSKSGLSLAYRLPRVKTEIMHGKYGPEIANRFFDTVNLQKGLSKILIEYSGALLQVIFGLLLLSIYHPIFIFFSVILVAILGVIFYFSGPRGMETALKESTYKYETAYWLEEVARTLNSFKLIGNSRLPVLQVDKLIQRYIEFRARHFSVLIFQYKVMVGFKVVIVTSLLIVGSLLLINDQISIGQFVAAEVIIVMVINSVEKLIISLETVYDTLVATEKLGQVMDLDMEVHYADKKVLAPNQVGLKFAMDGVTFQPQDSFEPLLRDVTLAIQAGRKVVVTGKSGSGKSALMALFAGLYEKYEGTVLVNELSLEYLNLEKYRSTVGIFLELEEIFHGTIRENILMGREFDPDHLDYILDLVGLKDYLYRLPDGLDAMLQPNGRGLSKSKAQKILLARGFVGRPKALIMENVLHDLEPSVRKRVTEYLLKGSWTLLMVSFDEDTLESAEEVIWMNMGKVQFQGTYADYKKLNA